MPHPSQLLTYKKQLTLTLRLKPYCHLGFVKLWSAYPVYAYHLLPVKEVTANETILYPKDLIHKINLEVLNYQKHCLLNCLSPAFLFLDQLPGILPSSVLSFSFPFFPSFLLFFVLLKGNSTSIQVKLPHLATQCIRPRLARKDQVTHSCISKLNLFLYQQQPYLLLLLYTHSKSFAFC